MPECRRGKFISVMNPQNQPSLVQVQGENPGGKGHHSFLTGTVHCKNRQTYQGQQRGMQPMQHLGKLPKGRYNKPNIHNSYMCTKILTGGRNLCLPPHEQVVQSYKKTDPNLYQIHVTVYSVVLPSKKKNQRTSQ